jgi:hypothetical protein
MVGTIEEAIEKAEKMAKDAAAWWVKSLKLKL